MASRHAEIAGGAACLVLGAVLLHDAFEGRGRRQPWFLRPFAWW